MRWRHPLAALTALVLACVGRADTPPDWLVGEWHGDNSYKRVGLALRVDRRGSVRLVETKDGRPRTYVGTYRRERLEFTGLNYRVAQKGRRLTIINARDARDWAYLERVGPSKPNPGGGSWASEPPDWLRGRFRGVQGRVVMEIEVSRNGEAIQTVTTSGEKPVTNKGRFRMNRLEFGMQKFDVARVGTGIRITATTQRRESWTLRRV